MNSIKPKYFLLVILPVIYLLFSGAFFINWRPFYTLCADPVYIYLFNGMNIGSGNLTVHYIDNPGIPVQYFCAFVIWVKHLFNHGIPLYQDVLLHPEAYLYSICATVSILWVLFTLYTGYYVFKRTGSIVLALLFQLTPLIGHEYLTSSAASPESFMLLFGVPFIAYLYCNSLFSGPIMGKSGLKQILIYSAFIAFLITCKYTCLPLVFLVLILLPGIRKKLQFIGLLTVFLLVFISPALPSLSHIIEWLSNVATHTGSYGQGDKGFAKPSEFFANLGKIFGTDIYFTSIGILLVIAFILALIKRKQAQPENKIYLRLLSGILLSSFILILLVAKHYSFHYLIPIRICFPLIIACSYGVFRSVTNLKVLQNKYFSPVLFYSFLAFLTIPDLKDYFKYLPPATNYQTADFLKNYSDVPLVITADFASARVEPALELGVAYSGNLNNKYWEFLKRVYPNSYRFIHTGSGIAHWDDIFYTPELFSKYSKIAVYFNEQDSNERQSFLSDLCMWGKDTIAIKQLVYSRKEANEYVYELKGNQPMAKALLANPAQVNFDFEKLTADKSKSLSSEGKDTISGIGQIRNNEHHSGTNSILMNHDNQFALNYTVKVKPGNLVAAKIWMKSDDGWGGIALTSKGSSDIYTFGHAVIDSDSHGWKQIEYKTLIPATINDTATVFYLYYYGNGYAYYDDLSINVYSMSMNNSTFVPIKSDKN